MVTHSMTGERARTANSSFLFDFHSHVEFRDWISLTVDEIHCNRQGVYTGHTSRVNVSMLVTPQLWLKYCVP